MAIQTVNADNLAAFVAERTAQGSQILNGDQLVAAADRIREADAKDRAPTPGNPVMSAGEERTSDAPPDPGKQEPTAKAADKAKAGTDPAVQKRIDEVVRKQREAEEFAEDEYNQRLRAERRIGELEAQLAAAKPPEPKAEELVAPDPKDFSDMGEFVKAERAYNAKLTDQKVEKARQEERIAAAVSKQNELLAARIELAKKDLPDFVEVIEAADRVKANVPQHVQELILESEVGPQIAYHLAKNPDEQKRIFSMTPAKALAALGRIEATYEKGAESARSTPTIETTRAPAPIATVKSDGTGVINTDMSKPMPFDEYKRLRQQSQRSNRH